MVTAGVSLHSPMTLPSLSKTRVRHTTSMGTSLPTTNGSSCTVVEAEERVAVERLNSDCWRVSARYGFTETPDVAIALERCAPLGLQVDAAELPTGEKSRLTATLADALLRAIGVDVLDKRLEALQAVLIGRKEQVR